MVYNFLLFVMSVNEKILESIQFYDKKFNMSNNELLRACTYLNPTFKNMKSFQREERDNVISSTKKLFTKYLLVIYKRKKQQFKKVRYN